MTIDIEKILEEKLKIVDKAIAKYIPEKYDEKTLQDTLGPATYQYHLESINIAVSQPVWDILKRGGKRWRPVLFILILEAFNKDPQRFLDFAILPEVIHNGTLIIDDIEDNSEFRRGKPCTYRIFGLDIAINAGNLMYFLPLLSIIKNEPGLSLEKQKAIYEIYAQEMINISFGQAMDIAWHHGFWGRNELSESHYLQMTAYKTGTLARMSAKIAAVLSDLDTQSVEKIGRLAESIGVAFQIQDDILDLKGEKFAEKKGGIGKDITEGKRSLMVIYVLRKASVEDRERLVQILDMHTSGQDLIDEAICLLEKYDSLKYAKQVSSQIAEKSWREIEEIIPQSEAKEKLRGFIRFLVEREI